MTVDISITQTIQMLPWWLPLLILVIEFYFCWSVLPHIIFTEEFEDEDDDEEEEDNKMEE